MAAISSCFFTPTNPSTVVTTLVSNPIGPTKLTPFFHNSPINLTLKSPVHGGVGGVIIGRRQNPFQFSVFASVSGGGGDDFIKGGGGGGGGGGGDHNGGGDGDGEDNAEDKNRKEALFVLAEAGRSLESLPADVAAAIQAGRLPGIVVERFLRMDTSGWLTKWLLQFGPFKERLMADDLFLAKVGFECFVGVFTKTAAEYDKRREKFFDELEVVFCDVVMAIIADFMLVYLPAPTVSLRTPVAVNAGAISRFFYNCPDNAFQIALPGTSYSFVQRLGSIMRNGAKLFAVGTTSSLVGTTVTNAVINARKVVDKDGEVEVENMPVLSTSAAYGVYMAVSSNLRYQLLAGVIEQRMLEPLFHQNKVLLSALCFAFRTGNTYLGSLLWVDYARLIGIQKAH